MSEETISQLPLWMALFAFWASLALVAIKIWELGAWLLKRPKLDLKLAPELLFRLTTLWGEALFCNPVFIASNGPVLILRAAGILRKTKAVEKAFPIRVLEFGEKVTGQETFPDHFHSKSAISYIPEAQPQRAVFLCVQDQYIEPFQRASNAFQQDVLKIRDQALLSAQKAATDQDKERIDQDILRELGECADRRLPAMMDLVQLEPGDYELTIRIDYKNPKAKFWKAIRSAESMISFVVEQGVRGAWRSTLRGALLASGYNILYNRTDPVTFPEYYALRISTAEDLQLSARNSRHRPKK